jgi:transcriptional regulator with XRE-family HTH domain
VPTRTLGENIKRAREQHGMSRRQLSGLIGVAEGSTVVADLENNRHTPSFLRVLRVAESLNVSLETLADGVSPEYERVRRDLLGHTKEVQPGRPTEGAADDPASARVLKEREGFYRGILEEARAATNHTLEILAGGLAAQTHDPETRQAHRRAHGRKSGRRSA